jgi:acyl transferase domain-containing protein
MQSMPPGAMLAVPLPEAQVRAMLTPDLSLSAINGPSHCVVAGPVSGIDAMEKRLSEAKLRGRRLQTSHAFHSAMMDPMLAPFLARVRKIKLNPPQQRYVSNVTGKWITAQEATDPAYYAEQIRREVRFSPGLEFLLQEPDRVLLEIGPGSTLGILAKQHPDPTAKRVIVSSLRGPEGTQTETNSMLTAMGKLWLAGCAVGWNALYKNERRKRIPLPTYPFEREHFWIDPVTAPVEVVSRSKPRIEIQSKGSEVDSSLYVPTWRQTEPLLSTPLKEQPNWLLFVTAHPLCQSIARRLRHKGQAVTTVRYGSEFAHDHLDEYTIAPGNAESYLRLLEELSRIGRSPRRIVHMWNIGSDEEAVSLQDITAAQTLSYFSLVKLTRALGTHVQSEPLRLDVITSAAYKVHSDDQHVRPDRALVTGPCKVIPQEYRNMTCRHLDLALSALKHSEQESLADSIMAELSAAQGEASVAYRGLLRYVLQYRPLRIPKPTGELVRLRQGGTYLITGGLGGIGMILAEYLARSCKAKLVLISRTGMAAPQEGPAANEAQRKRKVRPGSSSAQRQAQGSGMWPLQDGKESGELREQAHQQQLRQLDNLQRLGAEVMVVRADVTDLEAMQLAVSSAVARFGPIRGVIHAAGIPSGGVIQRRTYDAAHAVLAPKVTGTLVLERLFQQRDLDFFVLCSSLNSIVGGFGQADYCAANAFLDAFAHHRSQKSRGLTVSINWDAWREVGMAVEAVRARGRVDEQAPSQQNSSVSQYRELAHPLFDRFMVDERGSAIYSARLSDQKRWVLSEHRVAGRQTLPGTAYLELARSAYESHLASVQPVELRDVAFRSPMSVADDCDPEVRTILRATGQGDECEFSIEGRGSPERGWQVHASGRIGTVAQAPPVRHDIERFVREAPQLLNLTEQASVAQHRPMEFGPRWNNLLQARFGRSRGLALIQHPDTFAADLDVFMLHPALLDSATGFVASRSTAHFLPFGYRRIRVLRPIQSCLYSYAAFEQHSEGGRERLHIQLTVMDTNGVVLMEIEDYVLVKVTQ